MRWSSSASARLLAAIGVAVAAAAPLRAQQPMQRPEMPQPVVRPGPTHPVQGPAQPQRRTPPIPPAAYAPGIKFRGAVARRARSAPLTFTLTARRFFIPKRGFLSGGSPDKQNNRISVSYQNQITVGIFTKVGKFYIIDLEYITLMPDNGCRIVATAPGQRSASPCVASGSIQHVVFGFQANSAGQTNVPITFTNPGFLAYVFSATVAET